ncbi:MAG: 30S ribosomal protein S19e [Candidatus Altiarchaeota archaeon]|nr:30S ribosomal protein S19e [Candidatus Altiarchaeota archaeon]
MVTVYDVPADELIELVQTDLKKKIKMPEWAGFVKTGPGRQRQPQQDGWWWVRAASILRRIYVDGPVGVGRLRTWYGGRKDRGVRTSKTYKAGGKIIRFHLQELEKIGMIQIKDKKGRIITAAGQKYMDGMANKVSKGGTSKSSSK